MIPRFKGNGTAFFPRQSNTCRRHDLPGRIPPLDSCCGPCVSASASLCAAFDLEPNPHREDLWLDDLPSMESDGAEMSDWDFRATERGPGSTWSSGLESMEAE